MRAPAESLAKHMQPIAISSASCLAVTGMSWSWVLRFARAHDVPIWRVGPRKQLVPGAQLAAAMARVAAAGGPVDREHDFDEELDAARALFLAEMAIPGKP